MKNLRVPGIAVVVGVEIRNQRLARRRADVSKAGEKIDHASAGHAVGCDEKLGLEIGQPFGFGRAVVVGERKQFSASLNCAAVAGGARPRVRLVDDPQRHDANKVRGDGVEGFTAVIYHDDLVPFTGIIDFCQ